MSGPVGSSTWFGTSSYDLDQSLRFEDGSSTSLTLTPGTAGNRRTFTFSTWFKRGNVNSSGTRGVLFSAYADSANYTYIGFDDGGGGFDRLRFYSLTSSSVVIDFESTQQLRDVSAWYHLVVSVDTTQGTSGNRVKIYLNGEQITAWATSTEPSEDYDTFVSSTVLHSVGSYNNASSFYDGYIAETNFVDGSQLSPTSFGTTSAFGEWIPIEYTGAYGDEGFHLNFAGGGLISATGGTITTDGDFKVHSFTSNGTFTPTVTGLTQSDVEYLVIAGGGGAPGGGGGGGGAGGFRTGFLGLTSGTGYAITVGAGGAGNYHDNDSASGANSVFSTITSIGGGRGGRGVGDGANGGASATGGSGGGAGMNRNEVGSNGTAGQGNKGGNSTSDRATGAGGGGGASAVGGNSSGNDQAGDGGAGISSSITGSAVTYAGGGGGGTNVSGNHGAGGSGGGGAGATATNGNGTAGTANTGGGGGGGWYNHDSYGGAGGSGVVIVRYKFQ